MKSTAKELCDKLAAFPPDKLINFLLPGRSSGEEYSVRDVRFSPTGDHVNIELQMEALPPAPPEPVEGE